MNIFGSILLVLALSLDGLSISVALGGSRQKVGVLSAAVISLVQTAVLTLSIFVGGFVTSRLSAAALDGMRYICAVILIIIGITGIAKFLVGQSENEPRDLSVRGSVTLGLVLSLDSLFSGFAGGADAVIVIPLSFAVNFILLLAGNKLARFAGKKREVDLGWLSGLIFIALGICKLI